VGLNITRIMAWKPPLDTTDNVGLPARQHIHPPSNGLLLQTLDVEVLHRGPRASDSPGSVPPVRFGAAAGLLQGCRRDSAGAEGTAEGASQVVLA
jgi:hypothetical protein